MRLVCLIETAALALHIISARILNVMAVTAGMAIGTLIFFVRTSTVIRLFS